MNRVPVYTPSEAARRLREYSDEAESENYHGLVEPLLAMADLVEKTTERVLVLAIVSEYERPETFYVDPTETR